MRLWLCGLISSVGVPLVAMASDEVSFPDDWGQVSKYNISGTSCPSLEGVFAELAWTYRMINGVEDTNYTSNDDSYRIVPGEQKKFKKTGQSSDKFKNSFVVTQNDQSSFVLTRYDKYYWNDVVSAEVSISKDKLTCNGGWWSIPTNDSGDSGTEGYSSRMRFDRQFTRLDNKDLVVHVRYVYERTDWLILKDIRVEDTYYRYRYLRDSIEP
jgi:hypothetical protein